ncbi:MAG: DUF2933 domain-containing protein [Candidatus Aenigmarchaeota archaeon]|nr:DUF2933 domain-containing protein [Candidatus Aenigmarchaeota archaeon]
MSSRHNLLMLACIAVPVALVVAVYGFGIKSTAIYWMALLACPLMHLVMMHAHKEKEGKNKEGAQCH